MFMESIRQLCIGMFFFLGSFVTPSRAEVQYLSRRYAGEFCLVNPGAIVAGVGNGRIQSFSRDIFAGTSPAFTAFCPVIEEDDHTHGAIRALRFYLIDGSDTELIRASVILLDSASLSTISQMSQSLVVSNIGPVTFTPELPYGWGDVTYQSWTAGVKLFMPAGRDFEASGINGYVQEY